MLKHIARRAGYGHGKPYMHDRSGLITYAAPHPAIGGMMWQMHGNPGESSTLENAHHTMLYSGAHRGLNGFGVAPGLAGAGILHKLGAFGKKALLKIANYFSSGTAQTHFNKAHQIANNLGTRFRTPQGRALILNTVETFKPVLEKAINGQKLTFGDVAKVGSNFMSPNKQITERNNYYADKFEDAVEHQ